jgi:hypothetical protein
LHYILGMILIIASINMFVFFVNLEY